MEDKGKKREFDSALGGSVEVPVTLPIQPFLKSRIDEIEALTQLIETPNKNVIFTKKFPIHMRRRAMSQNVKRLPTRLREEMRSKRGFVVPLKRPSRKYRRRPSNLLEAYNRRQKKHMWLETHIWHAKRFHMIEKWGYKLPHFPNDKTYRACYRASAKYCLIQDISYYCCIELSGNLDQIINGLNKHCSGNCGLTFNSSYIQSGSVEGTVFFYSSDRYPKGAIGELKYFWQPANIMSSRRTLWLWCHPSFYSEVVDELIKTFILELEENMSVDEFENVSYLNVKFSEEERPQLLKNKLFIKPPTYNSQKYDVVMALLKDTLNRFHLTGPFSQALITKAFVPVELSKRTLNDWSSQYFNDAKQKICTSQYEFWTKMMNITDPGQLPRHIILGSIVIDPRFTLPSHRTGIAEHIISEFQSQSITSTDNELAWSPIWSKEVRNKVTYSKLSPQKLNEIRSEKLIPGLEVETVDVNTNDLPSVPLLFIQNPGEENDLKPLGYGSGWDIIVPCGYGQPVWLALSLHGGRAGGLKESESILRESGRLSFPPDTSAGAVEYELKRTDATEKYFRLPPAKRLNYIKLGIPTPFHCPWKVLIHDWSKSEEFHVLRNRNKLISIKMKLKDMKKTVDFGPEEKEALVPVVLTLKDKGTLSGNAHICIPNIEDVTKLRQDKKFTGPIEPVHTDFNEIKRKISRSKHKALLKSLARKRHKDKLNKRDKEPHSSEAEVAKQKEVMQDLWLPPCESVKDHCSRTIIGFLSEGDFSFSSARSSGVGYVSFQGLMETFVFYEKLEIKWFYLLVRNTNTSQYRFARVDVIC